MTCHRPVAAGCGAEGTWCYCIEASWSVFKPRKGDPVTSCVCANGYCVTTKKAGKACCRQQAQAFCCEHRCSVPCDEQVPCMLTILCLELFRSNQCTTSPTLEPKCMQRIGFVTLTPPALSMQR